MYYSRPTLISNWHKNREAEPKDYDFTLCPEGEKKLSKSTYKHFGTCMDADWSTSTGTQMSQHLLKKQWEPRATPRSMVEADHFQSDDFDRRTAVSRDTGTEGMNRVLPRHRHGHNQTPLDSTYAVDYLPPYGLSEERVLEGPSEEESRPDFRRRRSQFTDAADYRRAGRHTWQDESGVYYYADLRDGTGVTAARPATNPICP